MIEFDGPELPGFAAKLLGCAMHAAGRAVDPGEARELAARSFGYRSWDALAARAAVVDVAKEDYAKAVSETADGIERHCGLHSYDALRTARLMRLPGWTPDGDERADAIVDLSLALGRQGAAAVDFLQERGCFADEIDAAVRLRRAGKPELGLDAAFDRTLDIIDAFKATEGGTPMDAFSAWLSFPSHMTALHEGRRPCDVPGGLPADGPARKRLERLLHHARGTALTEQLEHTIISDILLADHLPVPADPIEIGAAIECHWEMKDSADRFFGTPHPLGLLTGMDWEGTWTGLDQAFMERDCSVESASVTFTRIARFLREHGGQETASAADVSCDPDSFLSFLDCCEMMYEADDRTLAAILVSPVGQMWSDRFGAIPAAISKVALGGKAAQKEKRTMRSSEGAVSAG